jgi:hypothetical protein
VLGLRWFRDRASPDALARDHGISRATAYRYLDEVTMVLAAQAPDLREALERAVGQGVPHVILDGKIIPADRCREKIISVKGEVIDLWYSGKAHAHGGNIQAVLAPDGFPLWVSDVEPGSVHDITAARIHALPALYRAAARGLPALADPGYDGAGIGIHMPARQPSDRRELDISTRTRNALQRSLRCLGERGFALLTQRWRTLQHVTASPSKMGDIVRAGCRAVPWAFLLPARLVRLGAHDPPSAERGTQSAIMVTVRILGSPPNCSP